MRSVSACGSITAPDRMCAPSSEPFSSTTTLASVPASAARCLMRIAAPSPAGPPPTMTTSNSMASRCTMDTPCPSLAARPARNAGLYNANGLRALCVRGPSRALADPTPPMSPLGITLLMLVAFAAFGYLAARKLRIVANLAPEMRWDHPGARLMAVVTNGFLRSRMIRRDWKPGVMHAVIFLGFMSLLVRKVQLIVIGYYEPFVYPGLAGGAFAAAKDAVELAVLAALAYAYWRRYVTRPARLEPNREALLVLSLITAI